MSTRNTRKNPKINGVRGRDSNYFSLRRCKIDKNKYAPTVRNDEAEGEPSSFISSRISWRISAEAGQKKKKKKQDLRFKDKLSD